MMRYSAKYEIRPGIPISAAVMKIDIVRVFENHIRSDLKRRIEKLNRWLEHAHDPHR